MDTQKTEEKVTEKTFSELGIDPSILKVLEKLEFKVPTPIQEQSIPLAIQGKDLMGIAQTGTGKTLAFGIPMLQNIMKNKGRGLVILPTRELALQVKESFDKIAYSLGIRSVVIIGGDSMRRQVNDLKRGPNIVIGTPGRIMDHLQQKTIGLSRVKVLVLDEADRMLDMGFEPQLKKILPLVPAERQTMLFSATMPNEIVKMANSYMKLPLRIEVAPPGTTLDKISQELFFVHRDEKTNLLESLIKEYTGSILVFVKTKHGAKQITDKLRTTGGNGVAELHSNRSLGQRREALDGFKKGKYRILVATDIAARGIDVTGIEVVINYDLPSNSEDYVHRIGRTGRAGKTGHAISFATPSQMRDVRDIERLMRMPLPLSKNSPISAPRPAPWATGGQSRGGHSRRRYNRPNTGYGNKPRSGGFSKDSRFNNNRSQRRAS